MQVVRMVTPTLSAAGMPDTQPSTATGMQQAINPKPAKSVNLKLSTAVDKQNIEERMQSFDAFSISPKGIACLRSPTRSQPNPLPHTLSHTQEALLILNEIGRGSTAKVYKCIYVPALVPVAVKSISIGAEKGKENALNELKALYSINKSQFRWKKQAIKAPCPYIVSFFDAYTDPNYENVCLVLDYMDGGTLQDLTDILFSSKWPRDSTGEYSGSSSSNNEDDARNPKLHFDSSKFVEGERAVAVIAYSVLRALEVLHSNNIIHRDVKPSNILINSDGEVKLSDFGCMREFDSDKSCHTFKGTISFMAPERLTNQGYGPSSDVWGLGICIYRFLMGTSPFPKARTYWNLVDTMLEGQRDVLPASRYSRYLRDFVRQCLLLDPKKRPSASLLLMHPFLLQAEEEGVITPPTQPTLKGLVPIPSRSESPARVKEIVRSVLEWEPEHADEMVLWPCAEEKNSAVNSSNAAATALKSSGDEDRDAGKKGGAGKKGDDVMRQEDNDSENWPANLAGKNGATLAAKAARRLANALNVEATLVENCVAERLAEMTRKGYRPRPLQPTHVPSSVGLSSELEALIATQGGTLDRTKKSTT